MINISRNNTSGYTLVELMVAISILALLFAAGVATYSKATQRSRDAARKSDLEQVRSALELYRADSGSYPSLSCTVEPCSPVAVTSLTDLENYIRPLPTDSSQPALDYKYRPMIIVSTKAYSYCLYGSLELVGTGTDLNDCTDITNYSYEVKNP